jgi:hypothetical protein
MHIHFLQRATGTPAARHLIVDLGVAWYLACALAAQAAEPTGFFMVGTVGYWANSQGHYRQLTTAQWTRSGGPSVASASHLPALPSLIYDGPAAATLSPVTPPEVKTRAILLQDNFLYTSCQTPPLVYRLEGDANKIQRTSSDGGKLVFNGGYVAYVHAASYRRATLELKMSVTSGEPLLAIAHNGTIDRQGQQLSNLGVEIRLKKSSTYIEDALSGHVLAIIPEAFPRDGGLHTLAISWNLELKQIQVDMPSKSYITDLPLGVMPGGIGLRVAPGAANFTIKQLNVLWRDSRPVLLYDGVDTLHARDGSFAGRFPPVRFPDGKSRSYFTLGWDLQRNRSLLAYYYPGKDFTADCSSVEGYVVRDLPTGQLDFLGRAPGGCMPQYGGTAFDGTGVFADHSTGDGAVCHICRLDWNAYDRGDRAHFLTRMRTAHRDSAGDFWGYADPNISLDGSIVSASFTHEWQYTDPNTGGRGTSVFLDRMFMPPPEVAAAAGFSQVTVPVTYDGTHGWKVSQTGPAGFPCCSGVTDRSRFIYEKWVYIGPSTTLGLHVQNCGFNLFVDPKNGNDWSGPDHFAATSDFDEACNLTQDFLDPTSFLGPRFTWHATTNAYAAHAVTYRDFGFNTMTSAGLTQSTRVPYGYQILVDPANHSARPGL